VAYIDIKGWCKPFLYIFVYFKALPVIEPKHLIRIYSKIKPDLAINLLLIYTDGSMIELCRNR